MRLWWWNITVQTIAAVMYVHAVSSYKANAAPQLWNRIKNRIPETTFLFKSKWIPIIPTHIYILMIQCAHKERAYHKHASASQPSQVIEVLIGLSPSSIIPWSTVFSSMYIYVVDPLTTTLLTLSSFLH